MAIPYQRPMPGATPGANPQRDGIAAALMSMPPTGMTGAAPPFGGIPGVGPQAAMPPGGLAPPPGGPMGPIPGMAAQAPGLALPSMMTPGQLPPGMNPLGAAGGVPPPQGTNPLQRPALPGGRAY